MRQRSFRIMASCFSLLLTAVTLPSPLRAFTFDSTLTKTVGVDISLVPEWALATVHKGDTLSGYCSGFLAQMNLEYVISQPECWYTIGEINGFTSHSQLHWLDVGQKIWLPALSSQPGDLALRLNTRLQMVDGRVNPLGEASKMRLFLVGPDDISRLLAEREKQMLTADEAAQIARQVIEQNSFITRTKVEAMIGDLRSEIVKLNANSITSDAVSRMIADAFVRANLPNKAAIDAMLSTQTIVDTRLDAVEATLKTKADTNTVEALGRDLKDKLTATEDKVTSALSPNGLINNLVVAEVNKVMAAQAAANPPPTPEAKEEQTGIKKWITDNMFWLVPLALLIGLLALVYTFLLARKRKTLIQVEPTAKHPTLDEFKVVLDKAATAEEAAALSNTRAERAVTGSAEAIQAVSGLTDRVDTLEQELDTVSALVAQQFEENYDGLMLLQQFPTQAMIELLDVGGRIPLTFEKDGHHYNLYVKRERRGLFLVGLAGRAQVAVVDAKSLLRTVYRALRRAQDETRAVEDAFQTKMQRSGDERNVA